MIHIVRRGRGLGALVLAILTSSFVGAHATPTDCMGAAPDGMVARTAPVVSPQTYGVCIRTGFAHSDSALGQCQARIVGSGPITSSEQTSDINNCLPPETYGQRGNRTTEAVKDPSGR